MTRDRSVARRSRLGIRVVTLAVLAGIAMPLAAQDVLIRNATVHTASARGSLDNTDVLVRGGLIQAVGPALPVPAGIPVVEAGGHPLTPALFGGITEIGIEEVSGEQSTVDSTLQIGQQPLRPEFDVTLAYNPASVLVPVARVEGIGFTALGAHTGGGFVAGQGGVVRLDGSADPIGPRALYLRLGSAAAELTGQSRAAQWMLLQQMVDEARGRVGVDSPHALLTPAKRWRSPSPVAPKHGSWAPNWPVPMYRCSWMRWATCPTPSTRSVPRWRMPRGCMRPG